MRFAIVENGGKQYRAVEGRTIEVDRLPVEAGEQFNMRVLLMSDGDTVMVGTPVVDGIDVKVTVVDHIKGPKVDRFKYRPKKRIRVRGGHRQQYTRLMVDFIGKPGEERKVEKPAVEENLAETEVEVEAKPKAVKKLTSSPKGKAEKPAKTEKEVTSSKGKSKPTAKKPAATKSSAKKTDKK